MNARDEEALAIWQQARGETPMTTEAIERMESRLREFFDSKTAEEYEAQLRSVSECMSCPETTGLPSSLPSPDHF